MTKRHLKDPAGVWDKTSLRNRLQWLVNSKVNEDKLASVLQLTWADLPFDIQVAIGTFR